MKDKLSAFWSGFKDKWSSLAKNLRLATVSLVYITFIGSMLIANDMALLTFLPMEEVRRLGALEGAEINHAKEVLAYEVTKLVHGEEEAQKALDGARAAFGGSGDMANVPTTKMERAKFEGEGIGVVTLIKELGLVPNTSEGFRTIEQGGLTVAGNKVTDRKLNITADMFDADGKLLIQKGKKKFHMVELD